MRRHIHGSGGPPVVERLISSDDRTRTIEYTIDANNPLPVSSYFGRVAILDDGEGSRIRWSADFEPAGDAAEAEAIIPLMLDALSGWLADACA
jgi:hypothetical protein